MVRDPRLQTKWGFQPFILVTIPESVAVTPSMDPVSLALGIAPLCLGALKGAKHAKSKIKLLRHHDREVSRFRKRLRTQTSIFRDESQLLIQDAGVDCDLAAEMLEDHSHEHWTGAGLEEQIQTFLGKKYLEVKEVVEQVHGQIEKFDRDLSSLEESDESSSRGKVSLHTHLLLMEYRYLSLKQCLLDSSACCHSTPSSPSCWRSLELLDS
jgi:hypothetical protein